MVGETPPDSSAGPQRFSWHERDSARGSGSVCGGCLGPCPWGRGMWCSRPLYAWPRDGARPSGLNSPCPNDRVAMGVYQALAEHGLDVPGDVSVVSFDGWSLATWLRPQVISVALPFLELGAQAVHALLYPGVPATGVVRLPMPLMPGGSVQAIPPTQKTDILMF